ncbi:MAG: ion transporter [Alistipes sp.]|nr:ion transporter [Alistipes sp.]
MRDFCRRLAQAHWFEIFIVIVIVANSVFIGIETYGQHPTIEFIQTIILGIFTFEIIVRMIAAGNFRDFFKSAWNNFDFFLVVISYIPESLFENSSSVMVLRVLRVFRVLRLLRTSGEIKLIISVLVKSFSALFYNGIFFFIFMYLFAIMGVSLFRLPDPQTISGDELARYEQLMREAPHAPEISPDPYGTLGEAMFTLFRALTGEDWTDLRYNLVRASQLGLVHVSTLAITAFHVVWFILSAFLLLNLVVGAIVNNYQIIMEQTRKKEEEALRNYDPVLPDKDWNKVN